MTKESAGAPSRDKIFLSWSGPQSNHVAAALQQWLTAIYPALEVFFSNKSIEKGEKWPDRLSATLSEFDIGIIIVNEQNKNNPWLLFEAGALSKDLKESRVIPLLCAIDMGDLEGSPLSYLQAVSLSKEGLFDLMVQVNSLVASKIPDGNIRETFEVWWERRGQPVCDAAAKEVSRKAKREPNISDVLARLDRLEHSVGRVAAKLSDVELGLQVTTSLTSPFLGTLSAPTVTGPGSAAVLMGAAHGLGSIGGGGLRGLGGLLGDLAPPEGEEEK